MNLQSEQVFISNQFYLEIYSGDFFPVISKNDKISIQHILKLTRITTFIKAKLKKPDDQTHIDKYRVAATEYYTL